MPRWVETDGKVPAGRAIIAVVGAGTGRPQPCISVSLVDTEALGMVGQGHRVTVITATPRGSLMALLTLEEVAVLEDELRQVTAQLTERHHG